MAAGRVTTGFSKPYVAKYSANGSTITYTGGQLLARGVNVNVTPTTNDSENDFYTDNGLSESAPGGYTGATVALEVDGLKRQAERLIYGLPAPNANGLVAYGKGSILPYIGVGFVVRQQEDGVVYYKAMIYPKTRFNYAVTAAATQERDIEWQTQTLNAKIFEDDTADRNWQYDGDVFEVGSEQYATEAAAEAAAENVIKTFFSIT